MSAISHFTFVGTCVDFPHAEIKKIGGIETTYCLFHLANKLGVITCVSMGNTAKKCLIKCQEKNVVSVEGEMRSKRVKDAPMFFFVEDITMLYRGKPIEIDPTEKLKKAYDPKNVLNMDEEEKEEK